ncbi:hypothetical protein EVAR_59448_1 [Eumeta japonica]|uniref:Reverse transcriptase domain-containing protein n=1 Tax=Eumeta variegata TaxID=151549 RepID=A0A4C1Z4B1_EUMVA|nr:hypothetical protein EVAR_59448_1 [Eumeta japonica]
MDELSAECLLYTDDQVFLAPATYELQEMVTKINDSVKKRSMKINVSKTKMVHPLAHMSCIHFNRGGVVTHFAHFMHERSFVREYSTPCCGCRYEGMSLWPEPRLHLGSCALSGAFSGLYRSAERRVRSITLCSAVRVSINRLPMWQEFGYLSVVVTMTR